MTSPSATTTWHTLLGELSLIAGEFLLYLDPNGLDEVRSSTGETVTVTDRWSFRRLLELRLRRHQPGDPPLLVHLKILDVAGVDNLPFDARHYPIRILDVRLPSGALDEIRGLPSRAVEQLARNRPLPERMAALARELSGVSWPPTTETAVSAVVRLLPTLGPDLRRLLLPSCPAGLAARILDSDDPLETVSGELEQWGLLGADHPEHVALRTATNDIDRLVRTGQVLPPAGSALGGLPSALRDAARQVDAVPEVERLLEALPEAGDNFDSWVAVAERWAKVRWAIAALPPTPVTSALAAEAWKKWSSLDESWQNWLEGHYGSLLTRTVLRLASVHQVAPFLASQVVGKGSRVLLLVMDGLGLPQWHHILDSLALSPVQDRRVLACLPTMTVVSRQAIFAGVPPTRFADTINDTADEPAGWRRFWQGQGLAPEEIRYRRDIGSDGGSWRDPPGKTIVYGIAINAIDDLMHGVSVNGDHQFHAGVSTWLAGGFLRRALDWAGRHSAQVWLTADHGNLPCIGLERSIPEEGVRVIGRGLRVRVYASDSQREASTLPGRRWTPPGFPAQAGSPLFAPGRTHFRRSGKVITHGGLSLDEVIVPFSRIF